MDYETEPAPDQPLLKKKKAIHKALKTLREGSRVVGEDGFTKASKSSVLQKNRVLLQGTAPRRSTQWSVRLQPWLQFDSQIVQRCKGYNLAKLPTLNSVDSLFSLSSQDALTDTLDYKHLARYSRLSSLLSRCHTPDQKVLLLRKAERGAALVCPKVQGQVQFASFGMPLSENETVLAQKRSLFMEKLKIHEDKYDPSLGRMSQISKELAFTYRFYLESRNQVVHTFQSQLGQDRSVQSEQTHPMDTYVQLLVMKNLKHNFASLELDPLNYFKMREYIQADRVSQFTDITSFEELSTFIQRRKPKRRRKLALATACSVCFSDYHELSNPLRACSSCGLHAHQLCYNFEYTRCGHCCYQKLERQVKQIRHWCFICRKPGLMVVRVDQTHYAHGFCLLVHGQWGTHRETNRIGPQIGRQAPCSAGYCLEKQVPQYHKSIEFYNPLQDKETVIKTSITENHLSNQWQANPAPDAQYFEGDCRQTEHLKHTLLKEESLQHFERLMSVQQKKEGCQRCKEPFFRDYKVTCERCGLQYHAFCAFMSGCKMEVREGKVGRASLVTRVVCCEGEAQRVGWNRRFKLNYGRCVYSLAAEEVAANVPLWQD